MNSSARSDQQAYFLSSNSRYESQQLEYTIPKSKLTLEDHQLYNYDIHKSINPNSDQMKSLSEAANSRPKLAIMRNFILRQGKDQDIAREPKVLTSFQKRSIIIPQKKNETVQTQKSRSDSKNAGRIQRLSPSQKVAKNSANMLKMGEKDSQKQIFFRYFTQQIVRITNKNSQLEKKLQQVNNKYEYEQKANISLREQNRRLKEQLEEVKQTSHERQLQVDHLRSRLAQEERFKLQKVKQQLQKIGQDRRIEEAQVSKYMKMIADKDEKNNRLMEEIRGIRLENFKLIGLGDENMRLNRKIGELVNNNQQLCRKVATKSETVDHLWNIKEIEYGNILGLIKMAEELV